MSKPSGNGSLAQRRRTAGLEVVEVGDVEAIPALISRPGVRWAAYYLPVPAGASQDRTAAIFLRISRDVREDAHGVLNQWGDLLPRLTLAGLHLGAVYVENSVSAWDRKVTRHAFERAVSDGYEGRYGVMAAWNQDRLGRRPEAIASLGHLVEATGTTFLMASGTVDMRLASGKLQAQIAAAVAEYESSLKAERIALDIAAKRERGEYLGDPPYGYEAVRDEHRLRTLAIVEAEAGIVRKMFGLASDGLNASQVTRWLNAQGFATPNGGQVWRSNMVGRTLRNPAMAGLNRDLSAAIWPGIVSRRVWEDAGMVLDQTGGPGRKPRTRNEDYLLSGLVFGSDGKVGKADRLYYKGTARRAYRANGGTIAADDLEAMLPGVLGAEVEDYHAQIREALGVVDASEPTPALDPNEAELARITAAEDELDDLRDSGQMSREHYGRRAAKLRAQREAIKGEIRQAAKAHRESRRYVLARTTDFLTPGEIEASWPDWTPDQQRDVIEALVERIIIRGRWCAGPGTTMADRVRFIFRWTVEG